MTAQELWDRFSSQEHIDAPYEAWAFCGGGEVGDRLAALVLDGTKTATSSALIAYQAEKLPIPKEGDYSVILLSDGSAACIIRTTKVTLTPFYAVSAQHAYREGEGDRSLTYWQRVHREAFTPDYAAQGLPFDDCGLCLCEEFELLYRAG